MLSWGHVEEASAGDVQGSHLRAGRQKVTRGGAVLMQVNSSLDSRKKPECRDHNHAGCMS